MCDSGVDTNLEKVSMGEDHDEKTDVLVGELLVGRNDGPFGSFGLGFLR